MDNQRLLIPSPSEHQTTPDQVNRSSDAKQPMQRNVCHNFSPLYIYKTKIVRWRIQFLLNEKFGYLGSFYLCLCSPISPSLLFRNLFISAFYPSPLFSLHFCRLSPISCQLQATEISDHFNDSTGSHFTIREGNILTYFT